MPMGGVYGARTLLCVNLNHVAELREVRGGDKFDPAVYAAMCDKIGCNSVAAHLRKDRHDIQDGDIFAIKEAIRGKFNLEIGLSDEVIDFARKVKPDLVTIVPELAEEMTAGGGFDIRANILKVRDTVKLFHDEGVPVSLLVEPDTATIQNLKECEVDLIEIHTGSYCNSTDKARIDEELHRIYRAADHAAELGIQITAGHGLSYTNVEAVLNAKRLTELNIGRSIILRSLVVGLPQAVTEMLEILE